MVIRRVSTPARMKCEIRLAAIVTPRSNFSANSGAKANSFSTRASKTIVTRQSSSRRNSRTITCEVLAVAFQSIWRRWSGNVLPDGVQVAPAPLRAAFDAADQRRRRMAEFVQRQRRGVDDYLSF